MQDCRFRPLSPHYSSPQSPSRFDKIPIAEVWQEYTQTRLEDIRNYLIVNYLCLIEIQANRMARRLPLKIDKEDLMSDGVFGLINAVETFDYKINVAFEMYSAPRIRGTIIEGLREMDWAPRLVRRRESKVKPIIRKIKLKTGRPAEEEEIARGLGITIEEFLKKSQFGNSISSDSEPKEMVPLSYERNNDTNELAYIEPKYNSANMLDERLTLSELRHAARGLTKQERAIVILRYTNGRTIKEIGKT